MSTHETVSVYFPEAELCNRLRILANKQNKSFSELVVSILETGVENMVAEIELEKTVWGN